MATKRMVDEAEDAEGLCECPKCLELSAEEIEGKWECTNGCDLAGFRQCVRCETLFRGTGPVCSSDCTTQA